MAERSPGVGEGVGEGDGVTLGSGVSSGSTVGSGVSVMTCRVGSGALRSSGSFPLMERAMISVPTTISATSKRPIIVSPNGRMT